MKKIEKEHNVYAKWCTTFQKYILLNSIPFYMFHKNQKGYEDRIRHYCDDNLLYRYLSRLLCYKYINFNDMRIAFLLIEKRNIIGRCIPETIYYSYKKKFKQCHPYIAL